MYIDNIYIKSKENSKFYNEFVEVNLVEVWITVDLTKK